MGKLTNVIQVPEPKPLSLCASELLEREDGNPLKVEMAAGATTEDVKGENWMATAELAPERKARKQLC